MHSLLAFSPSITVRLATFSVVACVLTIVRTHTTIQYRHELLHYSDAPNRPSISKPLSTGALHDPNRWPCHKLPRFSPWRIWVNLLRSHPYSTGACSLYLGGQKTHILFSPSAIQALSKARGPARDNFNMDIVTKAFDLAVKKA